MGNDKVTDHYIQVNFAEKYKATENFGKLFGDSNKHGDRSHKTVYTDWLSHALMFYKAVTFHSTNVNRFYLFRFL